VPPAERFYGGGATTVRGFDQNTMGPVVRVLDRRQRSPSDTLRSDTLRVAPVGGNQILLANAELRFPLPILAGRLRGALFVDAGQVAQRDTNETFPLRDFRVTPGVGIRVVTPIGPVRLDVAYNGYAPQRGKLYLVELDAQSQPTGNLTELSPDFAPPAPDTFWKRLKIHFAVGQAF